ncbi:MAG: hypothetical protein K2L27_08195 [Muribaculaceae bacterium]|nr:hypothetical protein [Muribaculaceae bacterium]
MATYKAQPVEINRPVNEIADRFSDLTSLQTALDSLPAEERAKVGDIEFTTDTIVMNTPQVGQVKFRVKEHSEKRVAFAAEGMPMSMTIAVELKVLSADTTEATAVLEIDIPAMLRPMIGGTMQKAVDQFAQLIVNLNK